jgi:hypothetical protein
VRPGLLRRWHPAALAPCPPQHSARSSERPSSEAGCRRMQRPAGAAASAVCRRSLLPAAAGPCRYAYFKKLDYFSTECIYSPFAARGQARCAAPRPCAWPCMVRLRRQAGRAPRLPPLDTRPRQPNIWERAGPV